MKKKLNAIILLTLVFLMISSSLRAQVIHGKLIDSSDGSPMAYVNVGVVNTNRGTITDERGNFEISCNDLSREAEVRFSMIGYESQTYMLKDLAADSILIRLVRKAIELEELVFQWQGTTRSIGTSKISKTGGVCGWGGTSFGQGHELGLLLNVGNNTARVESLNLRVHKQSFDTIVFRLHIRSVENGLPSEELLTENIYFSVSEYSGWQEIDLSAYNIYLRGSVVLSLEWIRISNVIEKNLVKMNGAKTGTPVVLFNINKKSGTIFSRRGSEALWRKEEGESPGFYIKVKE